MLLTKANSMSQYFSQYEDLIHVVVEYVPLVGTLYSLYRGTVAVREENWKIYWESIADSCESSIRDVVLVGKWAEPIPVTLVHSMAESFTEKMIHIYHSPPDKPQIRIKHVLSSNSSYVLISESRVSKNAARFFTGMAKGVYYFFGANFVGTLTEENYAWAGERIRLEVPRGFYDGAPIMMSWTWTVDSSGVEHRPEAVRGRIRLHKGKIPRFDVTERVAAGQWQGYKFWGEVKSQDCITVYILISDRNVRVDMKRVPGT